MPRIFKLVAVALWLAMTACEPPPQEASDRTGIRLLAQAPDASGFARALAPREFEFPRDHGAHEEFATEWWYFTGNLNTAAGRHFRFELTFFRYSLSANTNQRESRWGSNQVWLAHFALTDTLEQRFFLGERLGRGIPGIAGSRPDRLDVRIRDWSARRSDDDDSIVLIAETAETRLHLRLTEAARIAPHGNRGLDQKGSEPGNASYYYSIPRLTAEGTIEVLDDEPVDVSGTAWLDREWATSSLDADVEGWDWFGLQLDDGTNLMLYRLRHSDNSMTRFSTGTIIRSDGEMATIEADSVTYRVLRRWRSRITGVSYPLEWEISIPDQGLEINVAPTMDDQEVRLGLRYWEGAIEVRGYSSAAPVTGVGYLELAGYR